MVAAVHSLLRSDHSLVALAADDSNWRNVATYALASGIAIVVLVFAFGALAEGSDTPLHPWIGLFQWVMIAVWFTCTVVLSLRLMRVARAADAPR